MVIKCLLDFGGERVSGVKLGEEVMNQKIPTNNSSVAWFKIANLIERREREKALSVYKLMVHSLPDRAYALQLEGDILLSFEDIAAACEKYIQAAHLYQDAKRWLDAVSVYEHINLLDPKNPTAFIFSLSCYAQLGWGKKFSHTLEQVINHLARNASDEKLLTNAFRDVLESAKLIENLIFKASLHDALKEVLVKIPKGTAEKLDPLVKKCF
jgi:tetratricopeptide (TPR) repeat protein